MAMTVGELVAYLDVDDKQFNSKLGKSEGRFSKFGGFVKKAALGAGIAVAGIVGTAVVKGFQRLTSIENATAKLEGLGHSATTVKGIMDNALASVKGTAFGLDEAANVAASAVAAGIKPGQQLESTLKLVADAATIGGTTMGEMGTIFNKVAASNKVQGEVIQQMNERGIPIVQLLAKSLGKTTDEVLEMSSKGQIGFKEFSAAMEQGLGGAALKSGNTTVGAFKNVGAALSRFGASLLTGIFPLIGPLFNKITEGLDALGEMVGPVFERMGAALQDWLKGDQAASIFEGIKSAVKTLTPIVITLAQTGFGVLATVLPLIGQGLAWLRDAWPMISAVAGTAFDMIVAGAEYLIETFRPVAQEVGKTFAHIVAFIRRHSGTIKQILGVITSVLRGVFTVVIGIVKGALNIIAGVVRVVMALIRGDWRAAWNGVKQILKGAGQIIVAIVKGLGKLLVAILKAAWTVIKAAASAAWNAIVGVVKSGVSRVVSFVRELPGKVKSALGNLGSLLLEAGRQLIQGLINGITGKLGELYSKVKDIGGRIKDLKGPLDYDRKLLRPAGQAIIGGLIQGIDDQMGALDRQLGLVTGRFQVAGSQQVDLSGPAGYSLAPTYVAVYLDSEPVAARVEVRQARRARTRARTLGLAPT